MSKFNPTDHYAAALLLTPKLGQIGIAKILTRTAINGTPIQKVFALSADELVEEYGIPRSCAELLTHNGSGIRERVEKFLDYVEGKPVRVVTMQDAKYPQRLAEFMPNPPSVIICYGNLNVLKSKTFCAMASRNPTQSVLEALEKTVETNVLESKVLVTGANTPSYQRAAVVPLRWGCPRVLVLDRGIFKAFGISLDQEPFPAARLWRYRFDPETDLVVSQFRPDEGHIGINNKIRDETVAALSDELHVISAAPGGNVDRLSQHAEKAGRTVIRA